MFYYKTFLIAALLSASKAKAKMLGPEGCIFLEADVQYKNPGKPDGPTDIASCILSSGELVDIEGLSDEVKKTKLNGRASGRTTLRIPGATIEDGVLKVPKGAAIETSKIDKFSNDRYLSEGHRTLQTTGTKSVFVLRANAIDVSTTSDITTISDEIFGTGTDQVNLKSQYAACSYNKLIFEPYIGSTSTGEIITAGVGEVDIDISVTGAADSVVRDAMVAAGNTKYGNLQSQFDHVMLCLPGGTSGSWIAYAYINWYLSVYNNEWCNYPSGQMHELGHNLGLAHSGETATYDDQSGMMGYSYNQDEGPVMCFNAPKNWQLGWYFDASLEISSSTTSFSGRLIGISDYGTFNPATSTEKVIIKMTGIDGGANDFYVSFNRKAGINSGTVEGGNQVLVHKRLAGNGYQVSTLLAKLSAGGSYTTFGVTVTVNSINTASSPAYADITITGSTSAPTLAPTASGPTMASTNVPTNVPTNPAPTNAPTEAPTNAPTQPPVPTSPPTLSPTLPPTLAPTCGGPGAFCESNTDCCGRCDRKRQSCK